MLSSYRWAIRTLFAISLITCALLSQRVFRTFKLESTVLRYGRGAGAPRRNPQNVEIPRDAINVEPLRSAPPEQKDEAKLDIPKTITQLSVDDLQATNKSLVDNVTTANQLLVDDAETTKQPSVEPQNSATTDQPSDASKGDILMDGRHAVPQRLKDVVIPFNAAQAERMVEHFKTWLTHPPCPAEPFHVPPTTEGYEFYANNPDVGRNITLTLALSGTTDKKIRNFLLSRYQELPAGIRSCFREARVVFANFTGDDDSYFNGSRNMVEAMMLNKFGLKDPFYVLYIEPDCLPVRNYWLSALDAMTRPPADTFWIKGSLYRGGSIEVQRMELYARHLNGNAIYNIGDKDFLQFHFSKVAKQVSNIGYDTDRYQYFINHPYEVLPLQHRFQYSDVVQNMWHFDFSKRLLAVKSPLTYIVHGGFPRE
ncbi:hypothetical protein PSACC_02547 [Paramicrosporidium saccamoebae]|uniref:Uncharacterized protein n=1 Tax=Paramicrosporidium saccamoebae TaxID=1246581 RepID=A0A2H9TIS9_9FUNG|nr:hypothetical protein PSACC_02547 [Paramicrosporidium saccamoebae]